MPQIDKEGYTAEERERHGAAYKRLWKIIGSAAPDAEEFRRALDKELAAGFPIDFYGPGGWTLLHEAADEAAAIRAGLLQVLIEAGADVNIPDGLDWPPLGRVYWEYICEGTPVFLAAVNTLLTAGARPELEEWWKIDWTKPKQQARRDWLEAYIKTWQARARADDAAPAFDYSL